MGVGVLFAPFTLRARVLMTEAEGPRCHSGQRCWWGCLGAVYGWMALKGTGWESFDGRSSNRPAH